MAGVNKLIVGDLSKKKSKGSAYKSVMGSALSPSSISSYKPKTQVVKGSKK